MRVIHLGLIDYDQALLKQKALVREVIGGGASAVVTCEHPAVLTLGRAHEERNIFLSREALQRQGFKVISVDRGGDVTLHGPGQLVVYPIVDLKFMGRDITAYLHKLEQACVDFLKDFGIVAKGDDRRRGVWVGSRKIASIGIGVSRWVTYHGIAVNISTDLELFKVIRPCGLDVSMTSIMELKGQSPSMDAAAKLFSDHFLRAVNG
ncbi:MAG: lipoyl(octanoyl) transferase LipB [Candidatus Omnitrophica bacterium]|nr:lipoyl(octanoyl) transferase LipB [Candidatus Omnitrophota bacterium]